MRWKFAKTFMQLVCGQCGRPLRKCDTCSKRFEKDKEILCGVWEHAINHKCLVCFKWSTRKLQGI